MLDGSPELTALALRLHEQYGTNAFSRHDLSRVIRSIGRLGGDGSLVNSYLEEFIAGLFRTGYVTQVGNGAVLGERALEYAVERATQIEAEVERVASNLSELFESVEPVHSPTSSPIAAEDIHVVTRAFLDDLLREARIPPELVDRILETFEKHGRLTMSEDGQRYRIALTRDV